jgi:retron-type reverse transcriptase
MRKKKNGHKRKQYNFDQSPFFRLRSKRKLAAILGLTPGQLRKAVKNIRYSEFHETNEKGKKRLIENPCQPLKLIQRRINRLLSRIEPATYLHCPVRGRSYVSNAKSHLGSAVIRTLDVRKYFPSTSSKRVFWFWNSIMLCERDIAGVLTALSTHKGHLPTGSPLSPSLAHYAHIDAWREIAECADARGCKATVYIDDVTVSGKQVPGELIWAIKRQLSRVGLRYHKEKNFWRGTGEVTGVVVTNDGLKLPNRQHLKLHLSRKLVRAAKNKKELVIAQRRLRGLEQQARQVARSVV